MMRTHCVSDTRNHAPGVDGKVVVTEVTPGGAADEAGVSGARVAPSCACGGGGPLLRHTLTHTHAAPLVFTKHTCRTPHTHTRAHTQCREGDVLRATTAFAMQMTYPAANVLLGGARVCACVSLCLAVLLCVAVCVDVRGAGLRRARSHTIEQIKHTLCPARRALAPRTHLSQVWAAPAWPRCCCQRTGSPLQR
jgi:hypothetical protein